MLKRFALILCLLALPAAAQQVTFSPVSVIPLEFGSVQTATAANTTYFYCGHGTGGANNTSDGACAIPFPMSGTVSNLRLIASAAAGAGQSYAATIRTGPYATKADTAVTCTATHPATTCADTANSAPVTAGNVLELKLVTSLTAAAVNIGMSYTFTGNP